MDGKFMMKIKVIMFGDFHGSYHTFFRHMKRFEFQGIITWKNILQ